MLHLTNHTLYVNFILVSFANSLGSWPRGCPIWASPAYIMNINVYVDGFNLYYGAIKDTAYKWLDINKLCQTMFPKYDIKRIRYFTALVNSTPSDPHKRERQLIYIRALQTIPNLSVIQGNFMTNERIMPLVTPLPDGTKSVKVYYTEEKGSDVNLASYLVYDGCNNDYEQALVISNDTDLCKAIEIVCNNLSLHVHLVSPRKWTSWPLRNVATSYRSIRKGILSVSQFPNTLHDLHGTITKPSSW